MPLLIVPLLKVNGSRGKGLDGTVFFVQQLDVDLILTATVPARCIPEDKCLQSPRAATTGAAGGERGRLRSQLPLADVRYLPVRHFDVWLDVVHEGWVVAFFSEINELRLQAFSADTRKVCKC